MQIVLFCYGTLMTPRVMAAVIGRAAHATPATLAGYRSARLRGRDYPGLWPDVDGEVSGCCYHLVHRRELGRTDRYEGSEYRRRRVTVVTARGPLEAWVYLPCSRRARRDGPWSARDFERRAGRRYLRQITAWRAARFAARGGPDA